MATRPSDDELLQIARSEDRVVVLRLMAEVMAEMIEEGTPAWEVRAIIERLCAKLGIGLDEIARSGN
jgi:hypothetical protein